MKFLAETTKDIKITFGLGSKLVIDLLGVPISLFRYLYAELCRINSLVLRIFFTIHQFIGVGSSR